MLPQRSTSTCPISESMFSAFWLASMSQDGTTSAAAHVSLLSRYYVNCKLFIDRPKHLFPPFQALSVQIMYQGGLCERKRGIFPIHQWAHRYHFGKMRMVQINYLCERQILCSRAADSERHFLYANNAGRPICQNSATCSANCIYLKPI